MFLHFCFGFFSDWKTEGNNVRGGNLNQHPKGGTAVMVMELVTRKKGNPYLM